MFWYVCQSKDDHTCIIFVFRKSALILKNALIILYTYLMRKLQLYIFYLIFLYVFFNIKLFSTCRWKNVT